MSLFDYVKSRGMIILFIVALQGYLGIIFRQLDIPLGTSLPYFILFYGGLTAFLGLEYWKRRNFYARVQMRMDTLEEKYLLAELLPESELLEAKLLDEILRLTLKSMKEQVNAYAFSMEEYRDYLEMWIHEIKTPLASIRLYLENHPQPRIGEELDKVDGYLQQALFYARAGQVEKDFILKELSLKQVVGRSLKGFVKEFSAKKIALELDGLEEIVYGDEKWLVFMLGQIIGNAIKYMGAGPKLKIHAKKATQSVTLQIADNGVGIPSQDLGRIFEKGFTGENGRKFEKSTGIGLYLCEKMARQLGLEILVSSEVGEGTAVSLVFPKSDRYFKD